MSDNKNYIYGIHPILEALSAENMNVEKVYIKIGLGSKAIQNIEQAASGLRVPVKKVQGRDIFQMVGNVTDQGVVAELSAVSYLEFETWIETFDLKSNPFVLLLDEIEDVQNFGAILRSAAAAGASAVIVPKHRQAPVNATVFKTSAGTAGRIPIIRITNLNQTIMKLKEVGFWVTGLEGTARQSLWQTTFDRPIAIILGSEGSGIRKKTAEHCDYLIQIPMQNNVESLNASVSAAMVMFEIVRQKLSK